MTVNLLLAITIGVLFASGVYLMLSRNLIRVILGFLLAGHGVNLLLLSVGTYEAPRRSSVRPPATSSCPTPFHRRSSSPRSSSRSAVSTFLLAMAYRNYTVTRDPELADDPEDDDEFADIDAGAGHE